MVEDKSRKFGDEELCHTCRKEFREGCEDFKKDSKSCEGYVKK